CCRAYNDWSAEYCSAAPERLRWAAMLPFQDVELARAEARRTAALGAVSFYLRPNPIGGRNLYHRDHFPLWAEIERLGKPVCLHDSGSPHLPSYGDRMDTHTTGHILAHPFEAMGAMMSLIWYGVFERFPHLTVVHVEADAGWVPYLLQRMEQHWEFSGNAEHPDLKMRPTEYFRRNVFVACRGDEMTLPSVLALVGDDDLVCNRAYPLAGWPRRSRAQGSRPPGAPRAARAASRERRVPRRGQSRLRRRRLDGRRARSLPRQQGGTSLRCLPGAWLPPLRRALRGA